MSSIESDRLAAFLRERGGFVHADLELFGRSDGRDRGVFALQQIPRGTLLLRVPSTAVIRACDTDAEECHWMS